VIVSVGLFLYSGEEMAVERALPSLLPRLRPLGVSRRFARGELLFSEGDPAEGFYVLEAGEVRVYNMDATGREVEVARLEPGETLGEAVAFSGGRFPSYAQAVRESRALYLSASAVFRRIEADPGLAKDLVGLLSRKCLTLSRRVESLGLLTVKQRLAQYLLSQCSGQGRCRVDLAMKKGDLARLLGTVNETLSRTLRQMREAGILEVKGRRILIKNCPALRAELR
jgi:CRP-like cAMP-binding protein